MVMECQRKKYLWLRYQIYQSGNSGICTGGHSNQDKISKTKIKCWVVNLLSKHLSTAQEMVLAHGPNFAVTPKTPYQEYITTAEVACQSLKPTEAEEFRADIARVLKQARPPKSNISKEEWNAIKELRTDKEHLILTADKWVALVVMGRKDYTQKIKQLLDDNNTYRPLKMDPTNRQKNRLINILRSMKAEGRLEEHTYKKMYQLGLVHPNYMGCLRSTRRISP